MQTGMIRSLSLLLVPLLLSLYYVHQILSYNSSLSTYAWDYEQEAEHRCFSTTPISNAYEMAFRESLGFFTDISDERWHVMKSQARRTRQYSGFDRFGLERPNVWLIDNVFPILNCPYLQRVGGHLVGGRIRGDGPKWTCDLHRYADKEDCLVYSFGSNGVYTWEDALVELLDKRCEIHVFDPGNFARKRDPERKNIHYHQYGLHSSYDKEYTIQDDQRRNITNMKTFQEIQDSLGHQNRRIDLFKIDCEGCEWHTLFDWIGADIQQILIETHGLPHPLGKESYYQAANLTAREFFDTFINYGFALFSKEVNGYSFGDCIEWSYLKLGEDFWKDVQPNIQNAYPNSAPLIPPPPKRSSKSGGRVKH